MPMSQEGLEMAFHTVGDWETAHLDEATKWFLLSRAYLDSSIRLCNSIISRDLPHTFQHGQVVMGLCFHSVELFYKGVLQRATGKVPATHDLAILESEVWKSAPGVSNLFTCPFFSEDAPVDNTQRREARLDALRATSRGSLDQIFRYHVDRDGNPWPGPQGFMPELFLATLRYCSTQFDLVLALWAAEEANCIGAPTDSGGPPKWRREL
jgi:hypothetical protein